MDTILNTMDIDRSFDVDFVGSPNIGEDSILTSFTVQETYEIETTNSLDAETVRINSL